MHILISGIRCRVETLGQARCMSPVTFPPPVYQSALGPHPCWHQVLKAISWVTLTKAVGTYAIAWCADSHNQGACLLSVYIWTPFMKQPPKSLFFCQFYFHRTVCLFLSDAGSSVYILNTSTQLLICWSNILSQSLAYVFILQMVSCDKKRFLILRYTGVIHYFFASVFHVPCKSLSLSQDHEDFHIYIYI